MGAYTLTAERFWGNLLVRRSETGGTETRWHFDVDESGCSCNDDQTSHGEACQESVTLVEQVIEYGEAHPPTARGRTHLGEKEAYVPESVRTMLHEDGYTVILDSEGRPR